MLGLDSLSQAGPPALSRPGRHRWCGWRPPAAASRAGSLPAGFGRLRHRVRAALGRDCLGSGPQWVRAADLAAGRRLAGPVPAAVRMPHPRHVRSRYAGCRGPDFPAGARDSGLRASSRCFPLCSAVASQRDASGSGCGTDCQWKPRVQAGQRAMRLALFLLPIEQSRPCRSPRAGRPGAAPGSRAARWAGWFARRRPRLRTYLRAVEVLAATDGFSRAAKIGAYYLRWPRDMAA